jgi:microcystin-dependent protein
MSEVFLGSLMSVGFNFPPRGFALCNGQIMAINQNQALFALLGTTFGGDGIRTFALPNLQGRTPIGSGAGPGLPNFTLGEIGGQEAHTLISSEMPGHVHALSANSAAAALPKVTGNSPAVSPGATPIYGPAQGLKAMNPGALAATGGNQPHENRQPFLVINWLIALQGIFPTRN